MTCKSVGHIPPQEYSVLKLHSSQATLPNIRQHYRISFDARETDQHKAQKQDETNFPFTHLLFFLFFYLLFLFFVCLFLWGGAVGVHQTYGVIGALWDILDQGLVVACVSYFSGEKSEDLHSTLNLYLEDKGSQKNIPFVNR